MIAKSCSKAYSDSTEYTQTKLRPSGPTIIQYFLFKDDGCFLYIIINFKCEHNLYFHNLLSPAVLILMYILSSLFFRVIVVTSCIIVCLHYSMRTILIDSIIAYYLSLTVMNGFSFIFHIQSLKRFNPLSIELTQLRLWPHSLRINTGAMLNSHTAIALPKLIHIQVDKARTTSSCNECRKIRWTSHQWFLCPPRGRSVDDLQVKSLGQIHNLNSYS